MLIKNFFSRPRGLIGCTPIVGSKELNSPHKLANVLSSVSKAANCKPAERHTVNSRRSLGPSWTLSMERRRWLASAHKMRLMLHVAASAHLGYAIYYDYAYARLPALAMDLRLEPPMGGKFKYLTFLNGLLQSGYHLLAMGLDICRLRALRQLRDYLLASFVLPLALTVSVTFWTLCATNRESIYPPILDLVYPQWLNQALHTYVVLYALLELCTSPHRYPKRGRGLAGLAAALVCYLVWMHLVLYRTGVWVYPFLGALFGPLRLCFFALIVALAFGYYLVGEHVNFLLMDLWDNKH